MESIEEGDILVTTGFDSELGVAEVSLADATAIDKSVGHMFVADYKVEITAGRTVSTAVALEWKVMRAESYTGVLNTSGAGVGDAVYLSHTSAGKTHTIGTYPAAIAAGEAHKSIVKIGRVLKSHATDGVIMLAPATMSRGSDIVGKVTLGGGSSTTVSGLGSERDGAAALFSADGTTAATTFSGTIQSGTLTISHATSSDDCTYMIIG
jgi:hypothetical protein